VVITKNRRPKVSRAGEAAEFQDDAAARIAQRIVLDAGAQAARLKLEASAQTATIRESAEREAELVWRQASAQAAAIREAAEREAAELRAAVTKLSAGPGESVHADDRPAATSPRRPAAKSGVGGRSDTKGRQVRAMRKVVTAFVVLSLAGGATGAVEAELHGLSFFLFRNAGAGAGNSRGLNENQGPGQPDAPKPHRQGVSPGTQGKSPGPNSANRSPRGSGAAPR
jgi:hypothetical protein